LCGQALKPRHAHYLAIQDKTGTPIDHVLALFFKGPHSFTGEDVLELQAHGGPVVLHMLLARCLEHAAESTGATGATGLRLAQPGEFSQRAFLNGKLDLAQAEAIADLIDASTEAAARSASRSLSGEFSAHIHRLTDGLTHLRMLVEATLDFPEEELDFLQQADAAGQIQKLQTQLQEVMLKAQQGALLREGLRVVIAGQPNVGKSSLLNALAGKELAIVTPIAGTTRDKLQQELQIEGVPIHVMDTAGLRDSEDVVERMGIDRAWEAVEAADAVLFLRDLSRANEPAYQQADEALSLDLDRRLGQRVSRLNVWNKVDVASGSVADKSAEKPSSPASRGVPDLLISAQNGAGLDALRQQLLQLAGWQGGAQDGLFIARARHVAALQEASQHLQAAAERLHTKGQQAPALDLLAEELRLCQVALGDITGQVSSDELLGHIFSKFCIGK
jgi:tRNA modification GTPase